ncbi:MAG: ATP-dependent metallopeptidase FtsH/Yme1/Tma family protein [Gammaproteobacteria bacterium]|nr:MAG: ATP-dependent metallopeptidase FtsH/Yme1/Tma family protein [Gammaproteobacteria bacterium]
MAQSQKFQGPPRKDRPDIEINKTSEQKFWQRPDFTFLLYLLFILGSFYIWHGMEEARRQEIPFSEFLEYVDKGKVKEAVITERYIAGVLDEIDDRTHQPKQFITVPLRDLDMARMLEEKGVRFVVRHESNWLSNFFFNWVLPFSILFLLWGWMAQRMGGLGRGFLNIGNRIRIHPDELPKVTFDDVAGVESAKQELKEVVEFLKDPSRLQRLGARPPKGVLLMGPPGTGKTLLARAVAGEAGVPFFSISGSEFIEMFVGVGAARVRELFEQARKHAPCIIFIDEIDAVGGARGLGPAVGGHDEREQTLNQLLSEMDGFDPSSGVVVMAATNRPEILDKALLRAGRFDRQVVVDKPDLEAREAILKIHTRRMRLAPDVDLKVIAARTPGFVGADLENICNEAAIMALRHNHDQVTMEDFEAAIDRVIAGPVKQGRGLSPEEKRRVAYHESGHTLVAEAVPTGEPVHKVTIIPRGSGALGFTLQLPVEEKFLSTVGELKDQIAILLGGRTAEELIYGDVSSGAANDLERATEIARNMVTRLGMSEELGPATWGRYRQLSFLGQEQEERNYSEETARCIDRQVRELVEEGRQRAEAILTRNRRVLDALAGELEQREVMDGEEVRALLEREGFEREGGE